MYLANYSDMQDDYIALGKTEKEAIDSMMITLKNNAYNRDRLLDGFKSETEFADSEINVYKISSSEAIKLGYDIHYKNGIRV